MVLLLTGASGFVGKAVLKTAQQRGIKVRPVYRSMVPLNQRSDAVLVSELNDATDWSQALQGIDVVIHAAARAHIMREESFVPLAEYRRVNVYGALNLARQAAAAGIRRFIFISSIKVNGEATTSGRLFTADDKPGPEDAYGLLKAEAEAQLRELAELTGMEVTIIRPPLIYGPGVKGNLASLISWVRRDLPLPLGDVIHNRRSLVGLDNLVDLILTCAIHANAANQTFLVSDGEDLSTTELLRKIAKALGQPAYLQRVPPWLISLMAGLLGKKVISQRLLGSLQVDIHKTCELLDWKPSVSVDEGLLRTMK
jgi:nucleoside-diphosphate-sugar epimerase